MICSGRDPDGGRGHAADDRTAAALTTALGDLVTREFPVSGTQVPETVASVRAGQVEQIQQEPHPG